MMLEALVLSPPMFVWCRFCRLAGGGGNHGNQLIATVDSIVDCKVLYCLVGQIMRFFLFGILSGNYNNNMLLDNGT